MALLLAALAGYGLATAALRPVDAMRREAGDISRLGSGRRLPVPPGDDELAAAGRHAQRDAGPARALRRARARLRGEREPRAAHAARAAPGRARAGAARGAHARRAARGGCVGGRRERPARAARRGPARARARRRGPAAGAAGAARRHGAARDDRAPLRDPSQGDGTQLRESSGDLARPRRPPARRAGPRQPRRQRAAARRRRGRADRGAGGGRRPAPRAGPRARLRPVDDGRAFERFTRGDRARSRGGTGLGLAIVDAIARSHGGTAGGGDREGGGADVWIELPAT